jgi:putative transposase
MLMNSLRPSGSRVLPAPAPWRHTPAHRFSPRGTYILTAATAGHAHLFDTPEKLDLLRDTVFELSDNYELTLQAWTFLTNHYHLVAGFESARVPHQVFLHHLHRELALRLNASDRMPARPVIAQTWDAELTFENSWLARLHYVHHNPEHHGVVRDATDYPWCSARWFETNATFSFVKAVYSFPLDRVTVPDDF